MTLGDNSRLFRYFKAANRQNPQIYCIMSVSASNDQQYYCPSCLVQCFVSRSLRPKHIKVKPGYVAPN